MNEDARHADDRPIPTPEVPMTDETRALPAWLETLPRHELWKLADRFQRWASMTRADDEYVKLADLRAAWTVQQQQEENNGHMCDMRYREVDGASVPEVRTMGEQEADTLETLRAALVSRALRAEEALAQIRTLVTQWCNEAQRSEELGGVQAEYHTAWKCADELAALLDANTAQPPREPQS